MPKSCLQLQNLYAAYKRLALDVKTCREQKCHSIRPFLTVLFALINGHLVSELQTDSQALSLKTWYTLCPTTNLLPDTFTFTSKVCLIYLPLQPPLPPQLCAKQ